MVTIKQLEKEDKKWIAILSDDTRIIVEKDTTISKKVAEKKVIEIISPKVNNRKK